MGDNDYKNPRLLFGGSELTYLDYDDPAIHSTDSISLDFSPATGVITLVNVKPRLHLSPSGETK